MPYRPTALTRKNAEDKRDGLLRAARSVVAAGGFKAATVAAIAGRCQASVGSVYSYFDGRDRLLAEVFRSAASHEIDWSPVPRSPTPGSKPPHVSTH